MILPLLSLTDGFPNANPCEGLYAGHRVQIWICCDFCSCVFDSLWEICNPGKWAQFDFSLLREAGTSSSQVNASRSIHGNARVPFIPHQVEYTFCEGMGKVPTPVTPCPCATATSVRSAHKRQTLIIFYFYFVLAVYIYISL